MAEARPPRLSRVQLLVRLKDMNDELEGKPEQRRQDAHEKISLGGLIVKAGMRGTAKAVLLGGLLELARRLEDPRERERLRMIGDEAFAKTEGKAGSP
jgi:hypothetical protein